MVGGPVSSEYGMLPVLRVPTPVIPVYEPLILPEATVPLERLLALLA
jgi:hypothetical protein